MSKSRQVVIDSDHFQGNLEAPIGVALASGAFLMLRIRHCVECPKCLTRYLIAFSPYKNGSYLVPAVYGSSESYTLYCSCSGLPVVSHWTWKETRACEVSHEAYDRGYGTPEEIWPVIDQSCWSLNDFGYLNSKPTQKLRRC